MIVNKPKRTRVEIAEERLRKLDERAKEVEKTLKEIVEARKEKAASIERLKKSSEEPRKKLNKKKILLGALLLKEMTEDKKVEVDVLKRLDAFLERTSDREAFGFAAREKTS